MGSNHGSVLLKDDLDDKSKIVFFVIFGNIHRLGFLHSQTLLVVLVFENYKFKMSVVIFFIPMVVFIALLLSGRSYFLL